MGNTGTQKEHKTTKIDYIFALYFIYRTFFGFPMLVFLS